jgi:hypothetical protein
MQKYMEGAFYKEGLTTEKAVMSYDDVIQGMSNWSKLSGFALGSSTNHVNSHTWVCYKNTADPASITFVTRVLERK